MCYSLGIKYIGDKLRDDLKMAWLPLDKIAEIDKKIEELYAKIGAQQRYPELSLIKIVRKSGLKIYKRDFGDHSGNDVMGAIDFGGDGSEPTIYINKYSHPNNQKFTLAHELGHHVLDHRDKNMQFRIDFESDIYPKDSKARQQELEANYFAGALLMPAKAIRKHLNRDDLNREITADELKKLKAHFEVSGLALRTRIHCLRRM